MQGKVLELDRRWWPLWGILGLVLFAFAVVFGLIFVAFWTVAKVIGSILRILVGGSSPRGGSSLSRSLR